MKKDWAAVFKAKWEKKETNTEKERGEKQREREREIWKDIVVFVLLADSFLNLRQKIKKPLYTYVASS